MRFYLKRVLVFVCALALVFTALPISVTETHAYEAYEYGYSLLTTDYEKIAYREISEGIRNCERTIEFGIAPPNYQESLKQQYIQEITEATHRALRLVMADHPEYFWFDGDGSLAIYHDSWTTFKVVFETHEYSVNDQLVTKSNVNQYIQQVENAAKKILADMPTDSDLRKIHYLHDYLTTNIVYKSDNDDQTLYGALVEGEALCAAYARAYQYLLTMAGIRCWYVAGTSISPISLNKVAHAWNLLYLDGKCYYSDLTWDDQNESFHAYYMLSRAEMDESHFPDHPEDLPASCGHADLDYFAVHQGAGTGVGILTGSYDPNKLASYMKKVSQDTWCVHVEDMTGGSPRAFVMWLEENNSAMAKAVAAALGIEGRFSWSIDTLWDEYHVSIKKLPDEHKHSILAFPAKNPTCSQNGNTQYFVCQTCGLWFSDMFLANQINDKESVKLPALEHTYSKQMSDGNQHWMACKDCGAEKSGSRDFHYDLNSNGKCDVCNAKVEVHNEPTTEPTTKPTTSPTEAPKDEPTLNPGTEPTDGPTEEPTDEPVTNPSEGVTEPAPENTNAGICGVLSASIVGFYLLTQDT